MVTKSDPNSKLIAENRRARFEYHIEERYEADIVVVSAGAINSAALLLRSAQARHPRGL